MVVEPTDVEKLIGELEIAVDRLRSLYEQYFMGIEKLEPAVPRKDVDRRIHVLRKEQIRNTALRFRFQMILQRYNTFQTHWQRICREIENGTYRRHLIRATQRFGGRPTSRPPGRRGPPSSRPPASGRAPSSAPSSSSSPSSRPQPGAPLPPHLAAELADLEREFAPAAQSTPALPRPAGAPHPAGPPRSPAAPRPAGLANVPAIPRPAPRPTGTALQRPDATVAHVAPGQPRAHTTPLTPPAGPPVSGRPVIRPKTPINAARRDETLTDDRVRQLYSQYLETRRRQNESTAAVTFDAVAKNLRESSLKLREKHGRPVDFEVTIKDGKTVLRPVLK